MKVLLLEDDPIRIQYFKKLFEDNRMTFDYTEEADKCIEFLKTEKYDIIFLDHDLGGQTYVPESYYNTGSTVANWINENRESIDNSTIFIIHSYNLEAAKSMHRKIGRNAFLLPGIWLDGEFDKYKGKLLK